MRWSRLLGLSLLFTIFTDDAGGFYHAACPRKPARTSVIIEDFGDGETPRSLPAA